MELQKITPIKPVFRFGANALKKAQSIINHWHVFVPENVMIDDLLKPEAWSNISGVLEPMARIHVTSEPGYFIAELYVVSAGHLWANVKLLSFHDFTEQDESINDIRPEFEAKWISNRYKWGVIRNSDKQWLHKDLPTMEAAMAALASHVSEIRAAG